MQWASFHSFIIFLGVVETQKLSITILQLEHVFFGKLYVESFKHL